MFVTNIKFWVNQFQTGDFGKVWFNFLSSPATNQQPEAKTAAGRSFGRSFPVTKRVRKRRRRRRQ